MSTTRWEYRLVEPMAAMSIAGRVEAEHVAIHTSRLNELGRDGWELVAISPYDGEPYFYVMKRPLS